MNNQRNGMNVIVIATGKQGFVPSGRKAKDGTKWFVELNDGTSGEYSPDELQIGDSTETVVENAYGPM